MAENLWLGDRFPKVVIEDALASKHICLLELELLLMGFTVSIFRQQRIAS